MRRLGISRPFFVLYHVVLTALLWCSAAHPSRAQRSDTADDWKKLPVLLRAGKQPFADIVSSLTRQTGRSIIIDGEPMIRVADCEFKGTFGQCLDKVADTFDYNWKVSKAGIVLLTKRFRDPAERPQTNVAELRRVAQDITNALSAVPVKTEWQLSEYFGAFVQALTPAQREAIRTRGRVRIGELPLAQQTLLVSGLRYHLLSEPLSAWGNLLQQLTNVQTAFVRLEELDNAADFQTLQPQKIWVLTFRTSLRDSGPPPTHLFAAPVEKVTGSKQRRKQ